MIVAPSPCTKRRMHATEILFFTRRRAWWLRRCTRKLDKVVADPAAIHLHPCMIQCPAFDIIAVQRHFGMLLGQCFPLPSPASWPSNVDDVDDVDNGEAPAISIDFAVAGSLLTIVPFSAAGAGVDVAGSRRTIRPCAFPLAHFSTSSGDWLTSTPPGDNPGFRRLL